METLPPQKREEREHSEANPAEKSHRIQLTRSEGPLKDGHSARVHAFEDDYTEKKEGKSHG